MKFRTLKILRARRNARRRSRTTEKGVQALIIGLALVVLLLLGCENGARHSLELTEPTDHTIIPFGKGICGQVAISNESFVVPDVSTQDNYIACSINVKAEIVIPIFVKGQNIGQIDIDSNTPDPFTEDDERFLEFVCEHVATILEH